MDNLKDYDASNIVIISLSDMLAYLIRKWKSLLTIMIVSAILIGGGLSWRESNQIDARFSDISLNTIKSQLSENQVTNVEQLYQRYKAYRDQIEVNENYMNHSFLMRMDLSSVSLYNAEYVVLADQSGIISSFARLALGNDEYKKIADILGEEIDEKYVYEVVSIGGSNNDETQQLDVDGTDDMFVGSISNEYKGLMVVSINASNKTQCDEIAKIVDAAIQKHCDRLLQSGITLEISPVGANYSEKLSESLINKRQDAIDNGTTTITGYNTFVKNSIDTLSAEEKKLFEFYKGKDDIKVEHVHWKKYCVIGAASGLFIGLIVYTLIYLLSDVIHITEELEKRYSFKKFGVFYPVKIKKGLNAFFYTLADQIAYDRKHDEPNNSLDVIMIRLEKYLAHNGINKVYLAVNDFDKEASTIGKQIEQYLVDHGHRTGSGNPRGSADEMECFCKADAAIFIGTLNRIRRTNIQVIHDIGLENNSPLIGFLAIADV